MKILKMTLNKRPFDLIKSGEKIIEYREYKPFWISRLIGRRYHAIEFRNGRRKDSPKILVEYFGYTILTDVETPLGSMKQFAINLGKIIAVGEEL